MLGEFNEEEFDQSFKFVIHVSDLAYQLNFLLREAESLLMEEKVVRGLYLLKKAEAIINFLKAFDSEREYHEYLVVISNNIGYFLSKYF